MIPPDTIRLYGTAPDSIVDGPGLRYAVFVQGCSHGCPGCHNPDSQPCAGGTVRAIADVVAEIAANKLVQGVTISGGEPFEQAAACAALARQVRELGLDVWTYSGYRYEQLAEGIPIRPRAICSTRPTCWWTPFVQAQHSYQLPWRGSATNG
ncbi:MAG: 4Fe-4S single cluster domain-containing protein [Eggerthella lenta]